VGATCCPDGSCGDCGEAILERNCLSVEGNIYTDYDGDGVRDNSEKWKKDSNTPLGCYTTLTYPDFSLTYTGHTVNNQLTRWFCNNDYGVYYSSSTGAGANIEPEKPHTFTLSNWPDGYKPKSWNYVNYLKVNESSGNWDSGDFTTDTLLMPSSGWVNVHWELEQDFERG